MGGSGSINMGKGSRKRTAEVPEENDERPDDAAAHEEKGSRAPTSAQSSMKQRDWWAEEEHQRFLEALKQHGRSWRKIEAWVGTKTAAQIRSHAQKFFNKVEREKQAVSDGKATHTSLPSDMVIPPPRPKRKPKSGASGSQNSQQTSDGNANAGWPKPRGFTPFIAPNKCQSGFHGASGNPADHAERMVAQEGLPQGSGQSFSTGPQCEDSGTNEAGASGTNWWHQALMHQAMLAQQQVAWYQQMMAMGAPGPTGDKLNTVGDNTGDQWLREEQRRDGHDNEEAGDECTSSIYGGKNTGKSLKRSSTHSVSGSRDQTIGIVPQDQHHIARVDSSNIAAHEEGATLWAKMQHDPMQGGNNDLVYFLKGLVGTPAPTLGDSVGANSAKAGELANRIATEHPEEGNGESQGPESQRKGSAFFPVCPVPKPSPNAEVVRPRKARHVSEREE